MYTHYTFVAIIIAINALYFIWLWESQRRGQVVERMAWWLGIQLAAGIIFLPWLPTALHQLAGWPRAESATRFGQVLGSALSTLSLGPVGYRQPTWAWNIAFLIGLLLGLWPQKSANRGRRQHWFTWGIPALAMAAPIALLTWRGLATEAYLKFLIAGSAGFCLLLARGIMGAGEALSEFAAARERQAAMPQGPRPLRPRGQRRPVKRPPQQPAPASPETAPARLAWLPMSWYGVAAALIGISAATTIQAYYFDPAYARDDYRHMAQYIQAMEHPGDQIVLEAPGQQDVFAYYYRGKLPVHPLPQQRPLDPADLRDQIAQIVAAPGRIYAILWAVEQADPERILENELGRMTFKASETWQGNVRFAVYAVPDLSVPTRRIQETAWSFGEPPLLSLQSVGLATEEVIAGDVLPLRLTWQALRRVEDQYKVTMQLLDGHDQVIAQRDAEPGSGLLPTMQWTPGQPVADTMGVLVRPGTPPGDYRLILAVYRATDGERLPLSVDGQRSDHVDLGTVQVKRPATPPDPITLGMQQTRQAAFGALQLLGFDAYKLGFGHAPATPLRPGDPLQVALYWRAVEAPGGRLLVRLELGDKAAIVEGDAANDAYLTTQWAAGEVVRGDHMLWLPANLPAGRYPLYLSVLGDGKAIGSRVRLTEITVQIP
jgi:hypothetical protein